MIKKHIHNNFISHHNNVHSAFNNPISPNSWTGYVLSAVTGNQNDTISPATRMITSSSVTAVHNSVTGNLVICTVMDNISQAPPQALSTAKSRPLLENLVNEKNEKNNNKNIPIRTHGMYKIITHNKHNTIQYATYIIVLSPQFGCNCPYR